MNVTEQANGKGTNSASEQAIEKGTEQANGKGKKAATTEQATEQANEQANGYATEQGKDENCG